MSDNGRRPELLATLYALVLRRQGLEPREIAERVMLRYPHTQTTLRRWLLEQAGLDPLGRFAGKRKQEPLHGRAPVLLAPELQQERGTSESVRRPRPQMYPQMAGPAEGDEELGAAQSTASVVDEDVFERAADLALPVVPPQDELA
jgi:hypothetical protein